MLQGTHHVNNRNANASHRMSPLEEFFFDVTKFLTILALLALILSILLYEPRVTWWQRIPFVLGIFGVAGYVLVLNGTLNGNAWGVSLLYPYLAGLFFAAPPALWVSLRGELNWSRGLWLAHFLPAGLAFLFRGLRLSIDPALMQLDIEAALSYRRDFSGNTLYIKTYVIYFMGFISAVYYLILARYTQSSRTSQTFLGLLAALSFTLFYPYVLGGNWGNWREKHLILALTIEVVVLAYTLYVVVERYRGMLQVELEVNDETVPNLLTDDAFGNYLEEVFHGEKKFLRDDYTMEMLATDSGFSPAAWRTYFKSKDTTFLIVKKRMRIDHATQLIVNGYLDNHTVEALTSEIGYASRSTFYTAFQEIKGKPFPQYLQELRNN